MGKRAIKDDYSPVSAAFARYKEQEKAPLQKAVAPRADTPRPAARTIAPPPEPVAPRVEEPEVVDAPHSRFTESIRVRVTPEEKDLWHELAHRVTGKRNNMSSLLRAAWGLVEHAQQELAERAPQIATVKRPAREKHLERALYEETLTVHLYEALRAAGRPQEHLLKKTGS